MAKRRLRWLVLLTALIGPTGMTQAASPDLALDLAVLTPNPCATRIEVAWALRNISDRPVLVASHVLAGPLLQYDQLTLQVCKARQTHCQSVVFQTARAAAMPVQSLIQPGQSLRHEVDLARWLALQGISLAPGLHELQVVYRQAPGQSAQDGSRPLWSGTLKSPIVRMTLR